MQELAQGARDLAATVSAMRAGFDEAHTAMAKKTREERRAFLSGMIQDVNSLLENFSKVRSDMARKGRYDRETFLLKMKRQVTDMLKETADDLEGSRMAWYGHYLKRPREVQLKKEPEIVEPMLPPVKEVQLKKEPEIVEPMLSPVKEVQLKKEPEIVEPMLPPVKEVEEEKKGEASQELHLKAEVELKEIEEVTGEAPKIITEEIREKKPFFTSKKSVKVKRGRK
jgi:hypothetical protein